jgi:integrase
MAWRVVDPRIARHGRRDGKHSMGLQQMRSRTVNKPAALKRTDAEDRIAALEAELAKLKADARGEGGTRHRGQQRLSTRRVETLNRKSFLSDGNNLYLDCEPPSKRWVFRWKRAGKSRDYSIGLYPVVTLAEAREQALQLRRKIAAGIDPIEERKATKIAAKLETARTMTFRQCAEAYIASHEDSWRSDVHRRQWLSTLETYVYPVLGGLPVAAVDTGLIMRVIEPHWSTKTETMSRVRGRIEVILDWARVRGYRQGENPARWRGHLDALLPAKAKLQPKEHLAALPYAELPGLMASLDRPEASIAELALRFTILTAARTGEVLGAKWAEIDVEARLWTIAGSRMKAAREHRVPLSAPALSVLATLKRLPESPFVFQANRMRPISPASIWHALRAIRADVTVHGFRSAFSDWVTERTNYPTEAREMALAHSVGSQVEQSYRRTDLFERRRRLMDDWAKFITSPPTEGEIVPLRSVS